MEKLSRHIGVPKSSVCRATRYDSDHSYQRVKIDFPCMYINLCASAGGFHLPRLGDPQLTRDHVGKTIISISIRRRISEQRPQSTSHTLGKVVSVELLE